MLLFLLYSVQRRRLRSHVIPCGLPVARLPADSCCAWHTPPSLVARLTFRRATNLTWTRKDSGPVRSYMNGGTGVRVDTSPHGELGLLYRGQRDRMWRAVFASLATRRLQATPSPRRSRRRCGAEGRSAHLSGGSGGRSSRSPADSSRSGAVMAPNTPKARTRWTSWRGILSRRSPASPRSSGPPSCSTTPRDIRRRRSPG